MLGGGIIPTMQEDPDHFNREAKNLPTMPAAEDSSGQTGEDFTPQYLIFDLVVTILDRSKTMRTAFVRAYREVCGRGEASFEGLRARRGLPLGGIVRQMGLPAALEKACARASKVHIGLTRPAEEIGQLLAALPGTGMSLLIATGESSEGPRRVLEDFCHSPRFDRVVNSDAVARKKPKPYRLLRCMAEARASPGQPIMIGDGHADRLAARAASVPFILAAWYPGYVFPLEEGAAIARSPIAQAIIFRPVLRVSQ
jgi:phosphoglycolate phosphatase-like HAD superfamily hydrolase